MLTLLVTHLLAATLVGVPPANVMDPGASENANPKFDAEAISFADARCFDVDASAYPVVTFYSAHPTVLLPYGESWQTWEITAIMSETELTFVSGWFEFAFTDDGGEVSTIFGEYLDFDLDLATSDYTVDWRFQGGTGEFDDLSLGFGRTLGQADLVTSCAEYSFNGLLVFEN